MQKSFKNEGSKKKLHSKMQKSNKKKKNLAFVVWYIFVKLLLNHGRKESAD